MRISIILNYMLLGEIFFIAGILSQYRVDASFVLEEEFSDSLNQQFANLSQFNDSSCPFDTSTTIRNAMHDLLSATAANIKESPGYRLPFIVNCSVFFYSKIDQIICDTEFINVQTLQLYEGNIALPAVEANFLHKGNILKTSMVVALEPLQHPQVLYWLYFKLLPTQTESQTNSLAMTTITEVYSNTKSIALSNSETLTKLDTSSLRSLSSTSTMSLSKTETSSQKFSQSFTQTPSVSLSFSDGVSASLSMSESPSDSSTVSVLFQKSLTQSETLSQSPRTQEISRSLSKTLQYSGMLFNVSVIANITTVLSASNLLNQPQDIIFDDVGNLYITNSGNNNILVLPKISGILFGVSVVANVMKVLSSSGLINNPASLAFDSGWNLYIVNHGNNKILVLPASSGTLFGVSVTANTMTILTSSLLSYPVGLAFDSNGNLYSTNAIAGAGRILVLPKTSGTIFGVSVAANTMITLFSSSPVNNPHGLAIDSNDILYVANSWGNNVLVLSNTSGALFGVPITANVLTVLSASSLINGEWGLAFDPAGNLYISNYGNSNILVLPRISGTLFGVSVIANITIVLSSSSLLHLPVGLVFDPWNNLYISNDNNNILVLPSGKLFGVSTDGNILTVLSSSSLSNFPQSLVFDSKGNLYVTNSNSNNVLVLPINSGKFFGVSVTFYTMAVLSSSSLLDGPVVSAIDSGGNLYVANWGNSKILVIPRRSGTLFGVSVTANVMATLSSSGLLNHPYGLVFDLQDNLYIANEYANNILVLPNSSGTLFGVSVTVNTMAVLSSSSLLSSPRDLAFDAKNNLHITSGNKILVLPASSGTLFGVSVTANTMSTLSSSSLLNGPVGVIFDWEDNLYIANQGNNNILVFPAISGVLFDVPVTANTMTILSQSSLISQPICLAFDSGGNLYIVNYANNNILVLPI